MGAQQVLGELHRVQRLINQLSTKMKEQKTYRRPLSEGTSESGGLQACMRDLQAIRQKISCPPREGLDMKTSVFNLRDWLAGKNVEAEAVYKMKSLGKDAVFCIALSESDMARCSKEAFWPKGIRFRRWVVFRSI